MTAIGPRLLLACVLALAGQVPWAHGEGERSLVLVTDRNNGLTQLSTGEIRRLFLGYPVTKDGKPLTAAINQSDSLLYQVFLQKVVFMSANVYELHLLSNVVQLGGQLPHIFNEQRILAEALRNQHGAVSFMWHSHLGAYPHLVEIGELWRDTTD